MPHYLVRAGASPAAVADGPHSQAGAGVRAGCARSSLHLHPHPRHPIQLGGRGAAGEAAPLQAAENNAVWLLVIFLHLQ